MEAEVNNPDFKTLKLPLKSILDPNKLQSYQYFFNRIQAANELYFYVSNFIRSYIIDVMLPNDDHNIIINKDFINTAFSVLSSDISSTINDGQTKITKLRKGIMTNKIKINLKESMEIFFNQKFNLLFPYPEIDNKINSSYLSQSYQQYLSTSILTTFSNHIRFNFLKMISHYCKETIFPHDHKFLSKNQIKLLNDEDREIY